MANLIGHITSFEGKYTYTSADSKEKEVEVYEGMPIYADDVIVGSLQNSDTAQLFIVRPDQQTILLPPQTIQKFDVALVPEALDEKEKSERSNTFLESDNNSVNIQADTSTKSFTHKSNFKHASSKC